MQNAGSTKFLDKSRETKEWSDRWDIKIILYYLLLTFVVLVEGALFWTQKIQIISHHCGRHIVVSSFLPVQLYKTLLYITRPTKIKTMAHHITAMLSSVVKKKVWCNNQIILLLSLQEKQGTRDVYFKNQWNRKGNWRCKHLIMLVVQ